MMLAALAEPSGDRPDATHGWAVHDVNRPDPVRVTVGARGVPSDATILFDGTAASISNHWRNAQGGPSKWTLRDGTFVCAPGSGSARTRESFADVQLHLEFMTPKGDRDGWGNSGVIFMGQYEIQILDSSAVVPSRSPFKPANYADGQCGAVYGQNPPAVQPCRRPGEWQTYDIVFHPPLRDGERLVDPGSVTVFLNGVLVQDDFPFQGRTTWCRRLPHATLKEGPLCLQDHGNPVPFRNIWIRRIASRFADTVNGGLGVKRGDVAALRHRLAIESLDFAQKTDDAAEKFIRLWESFCYEPDRKVQKLIAPASARLIQCLAAKDPCVTAPGRFGALQRFVKMLVASRFLAADDAVAKAVEAFAAPPGPKAPPRVTRLACASHEVTLDLAEFGQIVGLKTAAGVELGVALDRRKSGFENRPEIFEIEARRTDDFTVLKHVYPHHAKNFACTRDGAGLKLTYADFGAEPLKAVTCTVRPDGDKLRWRIAAEPAPGWAVTLAAYPLVAVTPRLGADGADDTLVSGHSFRAGLVRNPGSRKWKRYGRQPGALGAQLACYCDPKVLFLYCAEDGAGEAKSLKIQSVPGKGLLFRFAHLDWWTAAAAQPYDVVTACRDAAPGAEPLSWHDGADIYKTWAMKQRWCRTPYKFRTDLPAWLRQSPVHANLYDWRGWCNRPHALEDWAEKYWEKNFPGSTLNLHFDGWEHSGVYVMTDYFPLYPDNAAFAAHAQALMGHRILLFPWPSGYLRAAAFDRQPDGSFKVDERALFARVFAPHACKMPDGSLHDAHYKWLKGGAVSSMCGGDPWTIGWFADEVCGRIADLGVPTLSGDQNIGGGFPACWDRTHPHPPGEGRWINDAARRQTVASLAALRARFPETAAFCHEEANEHVNDLVSYSYSREAYDPDCEWANVFTYLYHEYVPIYPSLGGVCRYSDAYALTAGLMPRLKPRFSDFDPALRPKFRRGDDKKGGEDPTALWHEKVADLDDEARTRFVRRWVELFSGEGREWLMFGRRVKPPQIACATTPFGGAERPAVFVGAYEALDGRRALVFANGTEKPQRVTWRRDGDHALDLGPYEVILQPAPPPSSR